jgi:diguanylate cyclase (GGDEF)-like protein/putative nucleotidyltransferase with HDIG domain
MPSVVRLVMDQARQSLPSRAQACVTVVILLGLAALGYSAVTWDSTDLIRFGGFLFIGVISAGARFSIPGAPMTLSLAFLFAIVGILQLSPSEAVVLSSVVALAQSVWAESKRPPLLQAIFNMSAFAVGTAVAVKVYHLSAFVGLDGEQMLRLLAAVCALFLCHTLPITFAIAMAEEVPVFATWRECYLWSLPYYAGGGAIAQVGSYTIAVFGWATVLLSGPIIYLIFRSYRLYVARLENEKRHAEDVSSLHLRTIEALALAIEAKDQTTHDHLARVQVYCREVGKDLGMTDEEMEALQAASILHDIGKLAVPEHIISKPGRLTPEEFDKMKIHPIVGAEILERVKFPYPVAPIVRAHHEKWDGTGYPTGLRGEEIPLGARILTAVDCLDALASDRQYRRALPLDQAMGVLQKEAGKAFDPRIVDLLSRRYIELEKMAKAQTLPEPTKLSTDVKVERGLAPDAGFEKAATNVAAPKTKHGPQNFLSAIAAARQEAQGLFELSQELGNSLSLNETMSVLGMRLRPLVPHNSFAVWIQRGDTLVPEHVTGDDFRLFSSLQIPVGQGLSGWVAENKKPIMNGNPSVESGYLNDPTKFSTLRSALAVPLEGTNGVVGVLALYHTDGDAFTRDHLRILLAVSSKIALSIENVLRFQQAEASATTDYLTNLPNARSLFLQLDAELSRSQRSNEPLTVLVLDLDGFKQINDRFGHLDGNRVLKGVAVGFKSMCRESDYVARMGGDEFVILLPRASAFDLEGRKNQLRTIVSGMCREMFAGELLGVSIGAASYPQDGTDAEQLLAEADRRMYTEKRARAPKSKSKILLPTPEENNFAEVSMSR